MCVACMQPDHFQFAPEALAPAPAPKRRKTSYYDDDDDDDMPRKGRRSQSKVQPPATFLSCHILLFFHTNLYLPLRLLRSAVWVHKIGMSTRRPI